jgi:acetyl esterase
MPLDAQTQAVVDSIAASGAPPMHELPIAQARQAQLKRVAAMGGEPEPVAHIENREIPGSRGTIPVRVYSPKGKGPFPLLVFFHGGGWVLGSLDSHDRLCRSLTNAAGCVTVAVQYRLAPEHKFPAGLEDCYAATQWVAAHAASINGDATRIAVGGDSAGGNLATVVALMARDRGGPRLVYQLLIYPVTDYYLPSTRSYVENADGYFLTRDFMIWSWNHYLQSEADAKHPYVSPLQAPDLSGLPPALVQTVEFDPLRDEGEQYVARLREAGVPVAHTRYHQTSHSFLLMGGVIDQAKTAIAEGAAGLRAAFGTESVFF